MSVSIRITSNWSQIRNELKRLDKTPERAKLGLDRVLNAGFKATQAQVHVVTGSLKSSGKKESWMEGDDWHGTIEYGGVSLGVNNPVTYAIYEKRRGGDHDFFTPLDALAPAFKQAIRKAL